MLIFIAIANSEIYLKNKSCLKSKIVFYHGFRAHMYI